jgi:hypothetical protein
VARLPNAPPETLHLSGCNRESRHRRRVRIYSNKSAPLQSF